jgi:hypothetical protein
MEVRRFLMQTPTEKATARRISQRGTTVLEVLLLLPLLALGFMGALGVTDVLMRRHESLIAARYGAILNRTIQVEVQADEISGATNRQHKDWTFERTSAGANQGLIGELLTGTEQLLEQMMGAVGSSTNRGEIDEEARQGLLGSPGQRIFCFASAKGRYILPGDTWASDDHGLFFGLLKKNLGAVGLF